MSTNTDITRFRLGQTCMTRGAQAALEEAGQSPSEFLRRHSEGDWGELADLYTSPLFRRAREFAEAHADAWYILSALHGLLDPERVTAPYDFTLKECSRREREQWAWRVISELRSVVPPRSHIIVLAGKLYREHLEYDLTRYGFTVEVPMRGLSIGQQLQFLITKTKEKKERSSSLITEQ